MPRTWRIFAAIFLLMLLMPPSNGFAQSQNREALKWYQTGQGEKDVQKRIAAYTNAIALAPDFVPALYQLGAAHAEQGSFALAEQFLSRAKQGQPPAELQGAILFELANVYHKLGKLRESEEAFRQAESTANDSALRLKIKIGLGRVLHQQNRNDAALQELKQAQSVNPSLPRDVLELMRQLERANEWEAQYQSAEGAEAAGDLRGAKTMFEQIRAQSPGYKNVERRIAALDSLLLQETSNRKFEALYQRALEHETSGNFALAIAKLEEILQQAGDYSDTRARLDKLRKHMASTHLQSRLEDEYAAGMAAFSVRDWTRAILHFENVLAKDRNLRDARSKKAQAQQNLERESNETIISRYYAEAVNAMNRNDLGMALSALEKVRRLNSNYRDAAELAAKVEEALRLQNKFVQAPDRTFTVLDSLYQVAQAALQKKDWMEATLNFEKIQNLQPKYRDVPDLLAQAKTNLQKATQSAGIFTKTFMVSGAMVLLICVPFLLALTYSPAARARAFALRGNYASAAKIYEDILKRDPGRVKLYGPLANAYLALNRKDKRALQVYKMATQLKLAEAKHEEINAVLLQNFAVEENNLLPAVIKSPVYNKKTKDQSDWREHLENCLAMVEAFDASGLESVLSRAAIDLSHPVLLTQVVMPLMQQVGERWRDGSVRVDQEHMASASVRSFLGGLIESYDAAPGSPSIIITTPRGQLHELGALACGIVAASEGWKVTYLGPNLPAEEIVAATRKTQAIAVALSLLFPLGDPMTDEELRKLGKYLPQNVALIVGGRAATSYEEALTECKAILVNDVHNLMSLRRILESVRANRGVPADNSL